MLPFHIRRVAIVGLTIPAPDKRALNEVLGAAIEKLICALRPTLTPPEAHAILSGTTAYLLIQRGGGNGPTKPRQPGELKIEIFNSS
jgi:hypothetical protein